VGIIRHVSIFIAACLIVRDEQDNLGDCLASLSAFADTVVVGDTGSTDGTVALAEAAGAEVHRIDWPDSFAAARNHALDLAQSDWALVIDADEWIDAGGEHLRAWCAGAPRLGKVCIHSAFDEASALGGAATRSARSWITRVLPRGARYAGRVHEQVVTPLPRATLDLHIAHDGYREAQLDGKRDRNRPLLLAELGDDPGNPYILYQLGRDADMRADRGEACRYYAASLAASAADANWRHELVVCFLQALGRSGALDAALALAERERAAWAQSPDFFFVLGNLLLDRAVSDPAGAIGRWLPMAAAAWQRCLEIGERPELEGSVDGRGSDLARHNLDVVRSQLALFEARTAVAG